MKQRIQYIILSILSLFMTVYSYAQEPAHREFDAEKIKKYKDQSDYQYGEKVRVSIWEWINKMLEKLARFLDNTSGEVETPSSSGSGFGFENIIVWGLAILAVAAILYIIFRGNWSWLFSGEKFKKKEDEYSVYEEDIHNINFTDEIELAVQDKNYRKATRLFYLKSLKLLSDAGYIDWKINKTNTDYRREIKDKTIRDEFDFLSFTFEYVWYGEFEPTSETFLQNFERFRQFNKRFQTTNA